MSPLLCYGRSQAAVQPGAAQASAVVIGSMGAEQESSQAVGASARSNGSCGGDYTVSAHEIISSPQSSYEVLELLGNTNLCDVL